VRNSFFLVIPVQKNNPELLASYEKEAINQWVEELPAANPSLSTRLIFDFIEGLIKLEMPVQQRLEALELIRPSFLFIEESLRARLIASGFPKGENEHKIFNVLSALEKNFTIGYWMVIRELTRRDVGWFQGKNTALAIQRTIKGLSEIVVTHYMMFSPVPDWVWIDLHSLYKLSLKTKKESTKVAESTNLPSKTSTPEESYKQVLLLSLTDPSGLMQKEIGLVYKFIGKICNLITIEQQPVDNQKVQCIILLDEDVKPYFENAGDQADSHLMYLNLLKLYKEVQVHDKYSSADEFRFSSIHILKNTTEKMPASLFAYLIDCWQAVECKGISFFSDRLDRYIAIGLDATHALQNTLDKRENGSIETLAESYSDRDLSCKFKNEGVLSIGSLVSFRKINEPESKRVLGIVKKIIMPRQGDNIIFEMSAITHLSYAVGYINIDDEIESEKHKALLYGVKNTEGERSYIIVESFMHKNEDVMRLFMNDNDFPIVLGNKKNIGLGYWQFECRQIEEKQIAQVVKRKKGYDFI